MANIYPGPFCQQHQITKEDLENGSVSTVIQPLPNGIIIEINSYLEKIQRNSNDLFNVILQLNPDFKETSVKYLKNKVSHLCEQKKKLASKKKVSGFKNVCDLLSAEFKPPNPRTENEFNSKSNDQCPQQCLTDTINQMQNISVNDDSSVSTSRISVSVQTVNESNCDKENVHHKSTNLLKYETEKLNKQSRKLEKRIDEQKTTLKDLSNRFGHYSVRNVNKRDDTAKKNLHMLRDSQRLAIKQERRIGQISDQLEDANLNINELRHQVQLLTDENDVFKQNFENEKAKKLVVQKMHSYYKNEANTLRTKLKQFHEKVDCECDSVMKCTLCIELNDKIQDKDFEIFQLKEKVHEIQSDQMKTKKDNGTYSDQVRLCVVELAKVAPILFPKYRDI